jgi:multicomponent Na+:H+ antiporter subunit C
MIWAVACALWITLAAGLYLALSRDVLRCVVGLALLGSAVNLLLLAAGRLGSAQPAVVELGERVLQAAANPLPQALVLTAIVIGFALICLRSCWSCNWCSAWAPTMRCRCGWWSPSRWIR